VHQDFVNAAVTAMWPHIVEHVDWRMRNEVEPIINDKLFSPIRKVYFKRASLGPKPIRVENIRCARMPLSKASLDCCGLHMEVRTLYVHEINALELGPLGYSGSKTSTKAQ
jgi:hypothetical protein